MNFKTVKFHMRAFITDAFAPGDQLPYPGCLSTIKKRPMINECQNCGSSFKIWAFIIDAFTPGYQLPYSSCLSTKKMAKDKRILKLLSPISYVGVDH